MMDDPGLIQSESIEDWLKERHPDLFTKIPDNQPTKQKVGQLSQDQLQQYFQQGFVIVDKLFDQAELEPVKSSIEDLVEQLAQSLYQGGKIKDLHRNEDLFHRLTKLEEDFTGTNILLHKLGYLPQVVKELWTNPKLLNIAEQVLGSTDIGGNPVWNLRTKTPQNEAVTVPWHQDASYLSSEGHRVHHMTAWIPLLDTNQHNGCMQMVRGGHKQGRMVRHHGMWRDTWYLEIEEEDLRNSLGVDLDKDIVTCPVPYGGAVLFSNIIPHRSLDNFSDKIRWSIDLRWQKMSDSSAFYGLKDAVRFRSSTDPEFKVNWSGFDNVSVKESLKTENAEFDTTIRGPWMTKWGLRHKNKHTEAYERDLANQRII